MSGLIMRFPKGKAKALTLSYDDGVEQDIRLMDIMDKNGLKGTFNLNSGLFAPEGTTYPEEPSTAGSPPDRPPRLTPPAGTKWLCMG